MESRAAALVGSKSHRVDCGASKQSKQGARQQARVLQLPLLITTTGRVNRPEQATTLISSLINKTLPPTAGLLHFHFYKNLQYLQRIPFKSICLLIHPDLLSMTNWTKPNLSQPTPTQPLRSQTITRFINPSPDPLFPLTPTLTLLHPFNNSPALLCAILPYPSLIPHICLMCS